MEFRKKEKYTMEDLLQIMKILRSPGGCPWDREQDHRSIRSCFLEETYEAVEAIDTGDADLLREELGDVLLQVVFHSQLESEAGRFDFSDVADGICKKMIVRHPHVFGDVQVHSSEEVLQNWDAIKKKTKRQKTQADVLKSVSPALPALMRSAKVQQKAEKSGAGLPGEAGALRRVEEETARLGEAIRRNDRDACADELSLACNKFIERFAKAESLAAGRRPDPKTASPEACSGNKAKEK